MPLTFKAHGVEAATQVGGVMEVHVESLMAFFSVLV